LPGLFGRKLRASAITVALSKFRRSLKTWSDKGHGIESASYDLTIWLNGLPDCQEGAL